MDEWRAEHRAHLLAVDDCPFCRVRTLTSGEEPPAKVGTYCMVHGVTDCSEPDCWRCGNHAMDDRERCTDPRCRALNDEAARNIARAYPGEIEIIGYLIGYHRHSAHLPSSDGAAADVAGAAAPTT